MDEFTVSHKKSKYDNSQNELLESSSEASLAVTINAYQSDAVSVENQVNNSSTGSSFTATLQVDKDESNHLNQVCQSFRHYGGFSLAQWENIRYRLSALPDSQKEFLPPALKVDSDCFLHRKDAYHQAVIRNQFFLDCILRHAGQPHSQEKQTYREGGDMMATKYAMSTENSMSKVSSVLKSVMRDWSNEGIMERQMSYIPIIDSVRKYLPIFRSTYCDDETSSISQRTRICVPGAGLGRLMCELCALGYSVEGNEFSLQMLLASDFILNGPLKSERPIPLSPWLFETRNLHSFDDQIRVVTIPDQDPFDFLMASVGSSPGVADSSTIPDFSMAAGEFASVYSSVKHRSSWDGIAACFFLDASPSIVEYLQVCYNMLRAGGLLISFGPLLWHWSGPPMIESSIDDYLKINQSLDQRYLTSFDFCWNDIQDILVNIGFEILECNTNMKALYTADCRSMMHTEYQCVHFVARKK